MPFFVVYPAHFRGDLRILPHNSEKPFSQPQIPEEQIVKVMNKFIVIMRDFVACI
jgi:hypothetical protein